jgi:hypothetical protein
MLLRAHGVPITYGQTARLIFAGAFASNFLPSTVGGDVLRTIGVRQYTGSTWSVVLASVFVDRLLNVIAIATFLPLALLVFGAQLISAQPFSILAGVLAGLWQTLTDKLRTWLSKGTDALRVWVQQPYVLGGTLLISWLSILVVVMALWLLAGALGINVLLIEVIAVSTITYIVTTLPISVNGLGVREVLFVTLYIQLGATPEQAAVLALLSRFLQLAVTLPGALWISSVTSSPSR